MSELNRFLDAIVESGSDPSVRLIFADWLDEHNRSDEAELMRLHVALLATCCEPEKHPERGRQQARLVELLAAGVRPCLPRQTVTLAEDVDMTFAWIPPGSFLMGSPDSEAERSDDETQHRVTLAQGFYLGIHEVTQAQWQAVMGNNPSRFRGKNRPVEMVSWDDCQTFCAQLSRFADKRFCLPSEAEWEYACRAGTTTPFFFGETLSAKQANYNGNFPYDRYERSAYREQTTAVGSFPSNAWGLFDLHGNVWEWCQDKYRLYEESQTKDTLVTENTVSSARVLRGGSWGYGTRNCRAAFRMGIAPGSHGNVYGFRVVVRPD